MRARSLYLGLLELIWAFASGVAPVVGGFFTQYVSWRWCFWINLPISGTAFIILLFFMDVHNPRTKVWDGLKAIDWFGSLSIMGVTLMVLLGLDFGGVTFPWSSPRVICLVVIGSCMTVVFVFCEKRLAKYPVMPLSLFRSRSNAACFAITAVQGAVSTFSSFRF